MIGKTISGEVVWRVTHNPHFRQDFIAAEVTMGHWPFHVWIHGEKDSTLTQAVDVTNLRNGQDVQILCDWDDKNLKKKIDKLLELAKNQ